MTATVASSGKPAWAVPMWADDNYVYMEIAAKDGGAPYISKFALAESGLSKALGIMRASHKRAAPGPINYTQRPINRRYTPAPGYSEAQREKARSVLRRLKIT